MQGFVIMLLATALIVTMTRHEFRLLQLRRLESTRRLYAAEDAGRLAAGIHLHDGVGQTLTALSLSIRNLLRSPQLNRELADRLDRCQRLVAEAHTSTRRLLAELHPPGLKDLGLAAAIESLLERIESQHHIRVSFERSDAIDPLPMPRRQLLYRCASELLENVVRHAHVDRAALALREAHGTIELEVRDQGSGWDTATWLSSYASGAPSLFGLKDQIELHGGRIEVVSSPGHGCCVRVSLPAAGN
jgi:signal transduction histidine kinase